MLAKILFAWCLVADFRPYAVDPGSPLIADLFLAQGYSNRRIALELGVNAHVVGRVRRDYGERGLAVLSDRHRSGRPRSSRNEQIVRKVIETGLPSARQGSLTLECAYPGPAFENAFRHRWPDPKGAEVISASVADFYLQS